MTTQIYAIESDTVFPKYTRWEDVENGKGEIYIFGRDEDKKKVMKKLVTFLPYFWLEKYGKIPPPAAKYIVRVEEHNERQAITGEAVKRVVAKNPKCIPKIRDELDRYGVKHFEADVLYRLNFTLDWMHELQSQGMTFDVDRCRVWNLDIETTTSHSDFPDPKNTPESIIMIGIHDNYLNEYRVWSWRNDFHEDVKIDGDKTIYTFHNEIEMMKAFMAFWNKAQPDFILGWNLIGFDIPYILNRAKMLGLKISKLSPIDRCWCWGEDYPSGETYFNPVCMGVVFLDVLKWYREVYLNELRGYSLDAVALAEGLGSKEKVNPEKLWIENWDKLLEYNLNDVYLTKAICDKRKIMDFVSGIRKVCWSNFDDLTYFSRSIDMLLLQESRKIKKVLPTKPSGIVYKSKEEREAAYAGGHVFAEKGIYHNGIGVFDFSALYPSIYRTFNVSYETVNDKGVGVEFTIPKTTEEEGEKIKVWVNQFEKGLIPSILENLAVLRDKYEVGLKEAKTTKEAEDYDNLIQATKNLILTSYGTTAMQAFRLFKREVSALITFIGRTMIREMARYVEGKGMKVCYNDTDSLFVVMNTEDGNKGIELQDELNTYIKDFCKAKWNVDPEKNLLKLKFEKFYKSILVDAKKRYAGWLVWKKGKVRDEINITGIQARRSDCSQQVQYLQPKLLELILKGRPVEEVEKLIFEEVDKIKKCENYEYIALPVKLGKEKYQNDLPKTRGIEYAKKFLGLYFAVGQKPLLIYISHGNEDALCFDANNQLVGKEITLNMEKMAERNIFLPLQSILENWRGEAYFKELKGKVLNTLSGQTNLGDYNINLNTFENG